MTKEASEQTVEIAAYDMGRFPETQEESDVIGMDIVERQTKALLEVIAAAFLAVFGEPITDIRLENVMRVSKTGDGIGNETLVYNAAAFLELGEMEESFEDRDGSRFMIINQKYRVLNSPTKASGE